MLYFLRSSFLGLVFLSCIFGCKESPNPIVNELSGRGAPATGATVETEHLSSPSLADSRPNATETAETRDEGIEWGNNEPARVELVSEKDNADEILASKTSSADKETSESIDRTALYKIDDEQWKKAQALVSFAQFAAAIEAIDQILVERPTFVDALLARARCYEILGLYDRAGSDYEQIINVSESADVLARRAFALVNDQPKLAKQFTTEALRIDGRAPLARVVDVTADIGEFFEKISNRELQLRNIEELEETLKPGLEIVSSVTMDNSNDPFILCAVAHFHSLHGILVLTTLGDNLNDDARQMAIKYFNKSLVLHQEALNGDRNLVESLGPLFQIGFILGLNRELGKSSLEKLLKVSKHQAIVHGRALALACWQNDLVSDPEIAIWCERILVNFGEDLREIIADFAEQSGQVYRQGRYAIASSAATGYVSNELEEQIRSDMRAELFYRRVLSGMNER
jgi:tetratricopeptide (TPR) repeat protein